MKKLVLLLSFGVCVFFFDIPSLFAQVDMGDAPEGALAYPSNGILGGFPTCLNVLPAGWIAHFNYHGVWFGPSFDIELDGNAGLCPLFNPNSYDGDECQGDNDAGLIIPGAFTIAGPVGSEAA